jgi:hypothetical protein
MRRQRERCVERAVRSFQALLLDRMCMWKVPHIRDLSLSLCLCVCASLSTTRVVPQMKKRN